LVLLTDCTLSKLKSGGEVVSAVLRLSPLDDGPGFLSTSPANSSKKVSDNKKPLHNSKLLKIICLAQYVIRHGGMPPKPIAHLYCSRLIPMFEYANKSASSSFTTLCRKEKGETVNKFQVKNTTNV
jgi:hypothetical protein